MKTLPRIARVVVATGITAGALTAVGSVANSADASTAKAAVANAIFQKGSVTTLPTAGGATATVASMAVPAGDWVVQSKANAVNWGPEDYIRCAMFAASTVIGVSSTTHLGTHPGNGGTHVGMLASMGVLHTSVPTTITLRCSHDFNQPGGAPYVEDGALLATRPGLIDG